MSGLRQFRDFSNSDAARRGGEPGNASNMDRAFYMEALVPALGSFFARSEKWWRVLVTFSRAMRWGRTVEVVSHIAGSTIITPLQLLLIRFIQ